MAKIEFENKVTFNGSQLPEINKCTAGNLNEIKESVNFLYDNPILPPQPPDNVLTVELMTAGNLSFNPVYDNGVDGVGATLTATANGVLRDTSGVGLIDNVSTPIAGTIIWVKDRTNTLENGPYEITVRGNSSTQYVLTRPEDYNELPELYPLQVNVISGSANGDSIWLQQTVDPEIGVDPIVVVKTDAPPLSRETRLIDTATNEPLPAFTYNATDKTITFDSVGYFGELNGCNATLNSNAVGGFSTFLVKDESNAEYNGTYRWINVGSSLIAPKAIRIDNTASGFSKNLRIFIITNPASTLYGKQYCVEPTSPPLTTAGVGTQPINFVPFVGTFPTLQQVSDTGGLNNGSTIRQGSFDRFGFNGIETVCSEDKRIQFANGVEYYYPNSDGVIVHANSMNGDTPDNTYDGTQGFGVGSFFNSLSLGKTFRCVDATTDNAVWIPMGGEYFPTLDNPSVAISSVNLSKAFYNINNGICDVTIHGTVTVDFSIYSGGLFSFTTPTSPLSNCYGGISFRSSKVINGIIIDTDYARIYSNDTSLIESIQFVAKFTYQAY